MSNVLLGGLMEGLKILMESNGFMRRHGPLIKGVLEFPLNLLLLPITIPISIVRSAPFGFGIPLLLSQASGSAIFLVGTLGAFDITFETTKKLITKRNCGTCVGWRALRCTMCKGLGKVQFQVKNYSLKSGEKPTHESIANAIVDNRAEMVYFPSSIDPFPYKDCPTCDGSGVMECPECKNKLPFTLSLDKITEPSSIADDILGKMEYPCEPILHSMKDPNVAAFWLFSYPEIVGGFTFTDEIKEKMWWKYKVSMRYDQLQNVVVKRQPGWEHLQNALISIDPDRAKNDPVIIKNIPYYKATKVLEAEVAMLQPPPRPENWGVLNLPLDESCWSADDLKDPKILYEMNVLLNGKREISDKILDTQWESKWREEKLNEMLEEKVRPHIENFDNGVLSSPIIIPSENVDQNEKKKSQKRRWWFF